MTLKFYLKHQVIINGREKIRDNGNIDYFSLKSKGYLLKPLNTILGLENMINFPRKFIKRKFRRSKFAKLSILFNHKKSGLNKSNVSSQALPCLPLIFRHLRVMKLDLFLCVGITETQKDRDFNYFDKFSRFFQSLELKFSKFVSGTFFYEIIEMFTKVRGLRSMKVIGSECRYLKENLFPTLKTSHKFHILKNFDLNIAGSDSTPFGLVSSLKEKILSKYSLSKLKLNMQDLYPKLNSDIELLFNSMEKFNLLKCIDLKISIQNHNCEEYIEKLSKLLNITKDLLDCRIYFIGNTVEEIRQELMNLLFDALFTHEKILSFALEIPIKSLHSVEFLEKLKKISNRLESINLILPNLVNKNDEIVAFFAEYMARAPLLKQLELNLPFYQQENDDKIVTFITNFKAHMEIKELRLKFPLIKLSYPTILSIISSISEQKIFSTSAKTIPLKFKSLKKINQKLSSSKLKHLFPSLILS